MIWEEEEEKNMHNLFTKDDSILLTLESLQILQDVL